MAKQIALPNEIQCKRCKYIWVPRQKTVSICPHCKSDRFEEKRDAYALRQSQTYHAKFDVEPKRKGGKT